MSDDRQTDDTGNALNDWNRTVISEFRANGGRVGGRFEGATVLLLHTTGARSGIERVNPLVYLEDGGRIYVFASFAGADRNPDWFHNLVAHRHVTIELGASTSKATARPLEGAERDRIFSVQKERHPGFAEYEAKTARVIPVIELTRA
ncbi:MAG TPA: nitroreductase family deazaflavin-dependent oxidoreductase [Acidimicrobiales bacterium]|nr:nitroreductase family deazaflavin-dependent oxidoreductase [Acidimicrobiales bacterium]